MVARRSVGVGALLLATLAEQAAAELAGAATRAHLQSGEVWAGNYTCGAAPAWLLLHVEAVHPRVEAVFHFVYPNSGTHGAFTVVEGASGETSSAVAGALVLEAGAWLMRPENAEMVGMQCSVLAAETSRMVGAILHPHCEAFELVKANVDVVAAVDDTPRALVYHTFAALEEKLVRAGLGPRPVAEPEPQQAAARAERHAESGDGDEDDGTNSDDAFDKA